jgi:transcriptional regulator with XRE-family HTH domain
MQRFGEKLRFLRTKKEWSMAELADKLEISARSYIGKLESGEKIPNAAMILKIARLFEVSLDVLMKDELELEE